MICPLSTKRLQKVVWRWISLRSFRLYCKIDYGTSFRQSRIKSKTTYKTIYEKAPGDYHMLEYSKNATFSVQMIINHNDSVKEYDYQAKIMKTLCQENVWQEVSMKYDFKVIFDD